MSESARLHGGHGHGYLPAMGRDGLLPLYDPFTRLVGVRSMHRRLADQAGIAAGHQVLEIGTGTGNLALLVKRRHPQANVVGLDPDPLALGRARRKAARDGLDVQWDLGSAAELPYPDGSVDRVLSALMFHHLDEAVKERTLTEVRRVLRPGGRLHLVDFAGQPHGVFSRWAGRNRRLHGNVGDQVPTRMREAGLTDVAECGRGRLGVGFYRATR
ncbi:class I SAM-dependent methyltransferase [Pseudonocardia sp. CA-142604]|uniref:class I SAM-dependent methyltransferase n=1 Tax=Pseudonocardia sp. CA-142604 TaxID=3240024 RepID=UPI003D8CD861